MERFCALRSMKGTCMTRLLLMNRLLFCRHRPVKMHMFPAAVLPLPDARFFNGPGKGRTIATYALVEPHITDHRDIAHDAHMGRGHARAVMPLDRPEFEIKLMEFQPLH